MTFKGERPCSVSLSLLVGDVSALRKAKRRVFIIDDRTYTHTFDGPILSPCSRQGGSGVKSTSLDQYGYSDSVTRARGFILRTEVKGQPFRAAGEGCQNSCWNIKSCLLQTFHTFTWRRMAWGLCFAFQVQRKWDFRVEWKMVNADLHIAN